MTTLIGKDYDGLDYHHKQVANVIKSVRSQGIWDEPTLLKLALTFLDAFDHCQDSLYVHTPDEKLWFIRACGFTGTTTTKDQRNAD